MAFTGNVAHGSVADKTANQAGGAVTMSAAILPVGKFAVVIIAVDNNQTTDGDEGAVTGITDDAAGSTNIWVKAAEFTNGQGTAQAGATCSIWHCLITTQLSTSNSVIFSFNNSTSRDASAATLYSFNIGAGNTVALEGTPGTLANDGADPGSLNVTTANVECLRVRGIAVESNTTTDITQTASWTKFTTATTTGGGSTANIGVRGEWIISTGTSSASDPTLFSADAASVYVAFREIVGFKPTPFNYQPFLAQ